MNMKPPFSLCTLEEKKNPLYESSEISPMRLFHQALHNVATFGQQWAQFLFRVGKVWEAERPAFSYFKNFHFNV